MAFNEEQIVDERDDSDNEQDECVCNGQAEELEVADAIEQKRKEELAACAQEVADLKETCKRVAADFENFKKRVERDRVAWTNSAQAAVLRDLLPAVDDFDRAIVEYQKEGHELEAASWISGFELIRKALNKFLQAYGVTAIEELEHFDPEFHEAIAQVDSPTHESGAIVDVVQKGYMLNGRVLRPARVTVAK
jgi:Molecular chaperone GrpE (heat shock protein)